MISHVMKEKDYFFGGLIPIVVIIALLPFIPSNNRPSVSLTLCLFTAAVFFTSYISLGGQAMIQQFSINLNLLNFIFLDTINQKINSTMNDKKLKKFLDVENNLNESKRATQELITKGTEKNEQIKSRGYVSLILAWMYLGFGIGLTIGAYYLF